MNSKDSDFDAIREATKKADNSSLKGDDESCTQNTAFSQCHIITQPGASAEADENDENLGATGAIVSINGASCKMNRFCRSCRFMGGHICCGACPPAFHRNCFTSRCVGGHRADARE